MSISKLSVNRPITTIMIFTAIVLLGFISWSKLPQELFPTIAYPQITVVTSYPNAAPEEIESLITKVIEEGVGTVNNVKKISSLSKEGLSLVMVEFNWGTNMDFAALNVREKIDLVKEKLPRESQEPIVMKYNPFDLPVMNLAVTGQIPSLELRETCRKYIKDTIEKVEGVASATITGGDEREILVEIDQPRLRASQISIVSIVDSLKAANINYPAGTIKESFYEYIIRTMGEYQKVEEIKETPTALDLQEEQAKTEQEKDNSVRRLVYLRDIGKVKDSIREKTSISRYNGNDSVSIVIRKQSGTNTLSVVKGVKREIQKLLKEKIIKDIHIQTTYDQSQFIREAISNLRNAGIQGGLLSFLVLFLFLWEIKSSLIITIAIPICVTATATMMYFSGINMNLMSLGGLAMGVGMVVDNANIVIENIFRYRHLGKSFKEAIIAGTDEMVPAIMGSTLTNIVVFLPFVFVVGIIGQIFKQLSFTISFSLITSIIAAISLVPVLLLLAGASGREEKIINKVQIKTNKYAGLFKERLSVLLQRKKTILMIVLLLFISSIIILATHEKKFLPKVDQRQFIVKVDLPPGSRLETTDRAVKKIERLLLNLPEIKDVTVNIGSSEERTSVEATAVIQTLGSNQAQLLVDLKKKSTRLRLSRSTEEVIQRLKEKLEKQDLEGAVIEYIVQETSFGTALEQGAPIAIEIKGPDLNNLTEISKVIQSRLNKIQGIYGIKNSMPSPSPETKLHVLKDKASLYGLSVRDIAITAQVALKGYVATKFKEKEGQEDVDIRVRLRPEDRNDFSNLRRLLIHSPLGMDVSLSDVAYFSKGRGPTEIRRADQQRSILLTANIYKRNFSQITNEINNITRSIKLQAKDYSIELTGEQQRMKESFQSLAFALILAFILVYMIMAAEFESLWQPFLIMFTIPLSLIGVAISLWITHTPLSTVVYLGIIMLGGIAVNNGIVLIELVNVLRKEGYSPFEAVTEASKTRLRPILMTSLTTILGLLPLALGIGEGSELQAPLAITVMGGNITSTIFTLIFIPALYLIMVEHLEKKPILPQAKTVPEEIKTTPTPPPAPTVASPEVKPTIAPPITAATPLVYKETQTAPPPEKELNPRQHELLVKFKELKKITRKEYARMFNISIPTASRDLKEMTEKGIIKGQGPLGPGRWYELV